MSGHVALVRPSSEPVSRPVSQPHDAAEREADRIADRVVHGGSVGAWSFSRTPPTDPGHVLREERPAKPDDEKKEAVTAASKAALETDPGKRLKAQVLADPTVQKLQAAVTTTPGLVVTGLIAGGGVVALGAAGKPLPFQPPAIPLDSVMPGLSANVTVEGPVNAPTQVGLTLTFEPKAAKDRKKADPIAADIARLRAEREMLKPAAEKAAEKQAEDEFVQAWVARRGLTIPLRPDATKKPEDPRNEEQAPVQPAPATSGAAMPGHANVEAALASPGHPLEPGTRHRMETRFGHDFSRVRVHDDARSAAVASSISAAAFTVGSDIVVGRGRHDESAGGDRLLAHELAHVVQGGRATDGRETSSSTAATAGLGHRRARRFDTLGTGSGATLPAAVVGDLREHFGRDIPDVRVHTDSFATMTAERLGANAFTYGRDIYFATGKYSPGSPTGWRRLAHEVAHALQQRGSSAPNQDSRARLDDEAERAALRGSSVALSSVGRMVLCEPTYPRRTTADTMLREVQRVLSQTREPDSEDETTRMWSRVRSNFTGPVTAGSIARRIWTSIFARHFTEPDARPGVESRHPRYFYSRTYGWVDGQHFFGFIDYAERELDKRPRDRETAFRAATQRGVDLERTQQRVRDYVQLSPPAATSDPIRLMQVQPPNTPLFRAPQAIANTVTHELAALYGDVALRETEGELFALLDRQQRRKFFDDSAKSAWSYEDIVSNQLGVRFFHEYGRLINDLWSPMREAYFVAYLAMFFGEIGVLNDQRRLDEQAVTDRLPGQERHLRPRSTEQMSRERHPDLFRLPQP